MTNSRLGNADVPLILEVAFRNLRDLEIQTRFSIFSSSFIHCQLIGEEIMFLFVLGLFLMHGYFCVLFILLPLTLQRSGWLSIYIPTQIWPT